MKDTLVISGDSSGAEVIPFIKVWFMFPCSILVTYFFARLSNRLNREFVFYIMLGAFLTYFAIFTFMIYPIRESFHPHQTADYLQTILPAGCKGFVSMFRNWTCTTFYVMSELWSNIILSMLFWGFANQVTRIGEAARFYGLFGVGANLSGIASGYISVLVCRREFNPNLPFGADQWGQSMVILIGLVILAGILAMFVFRWFNRSVLTDKLFYEEDQENGDKKIKGKISLRESIRTLCKSRTLVYIALIVIAYNVVINLVEVLWKNEVKALYPNPSDYNIYMNQVTVFIGCVATLVSLFISGNSIRKLGWSITAMATPVILFITSILFFGSYFMKEWHPELLGGYGISALAIVVAFGSLQNICSRAAKYTVFDATREMAFIPLSAEHKLKGKAVVDGLCSRMGKSGGSVIYQGLLITFTTISASAPYVGVFLMMTIIVWASATHKLGQEFKLLTSGQKDETEPLKVVTIKDQLEEQLA